MLIERAHYNADYSLCMEGHFQAEPFQPWLSIKELPKKGCTTNPFFNGLKTPDIYSVKLNILG